jgi:hypothetical protein
MTFTPSFVATFANKTFAGNLRSSGLPCYLKFIRNEH